MLIVDFIIFNKNYELNYGFIGAYGSRNANFIVAKSDLILAIGSRLDVRQVGGKRYNFAPNATLIRVDIDSAELEYKIRPDEISIQADAENVIHYLIQNANYDENKYLEWHQTCKIITHKLEGMDDKKYNLFGRLSDPAL